MDREHQGLLAPTPELLATVKVFPLIPSLKKDVIVSSPAIIAPQTDIERDPSFATENNRYVRHCSSPSLSSSQSQIVL